jgi:hypothetical protein
VTPRIHAVGVFFAIGDVSPNLFVAHLTANIRLGWLTGHESHGFTIQSSVDTNVVFEKFSHGFFKNL